MRLFMLTQMDAVKLSSIDVWSYCWTPARLCAGWLRPYTNAFVEKISEYDTVELVAGRLVGKDKA